MDYSLIVLIALIAVTLVGSITLHSRAWPGRPGAEYQRVFSVGAMGILLTVAGVIGWDLKYVRGWFQGTKWVDGPIWWQIGLGAVLLALASFWARRIPSRLTPR